MFHPAFDFSRTPQKASNIKITVLTANASSCFLFDIQQINVCTKPNAKNNPNLKVGKKIMLTFAVRSPLKGKLYLDERKR